MGKSKRVGSLYSHMFKRKNSKIVNRNCKVVIVGDGCVGKTCLLHRFKNDKFYKDYVPTVFDTYAAKIHITDTQHVTLELWDTAGQEQYEKLRPLSYANADIIILTYSIDNLTSFENIKQLWLPELHTFFPNGLPKLILVGNKSDLHSGVAGGRRCSFKKGDLVLKEEGQRLAEEIEADGFFECSAKIGDNVQKVFHASGACFMKKENEVDDEPRYIKLQGACCAIL